jgi:HPt (histidine-containing phosphotransfer) domain-containing protein
MSEEGKELSEAIDPSALASLRELQGEGEPDIVSEVCDLFVKHAPERITSIEQAIKSGDAKGLLMAAHSLKSSSAYVGAMRLSTLSKELELMGRTGALEGAKEKADALVAEYSRVINALDAEIKAGGQR